jgi:hypothetical protein
MIGKMEMCLRCGTMGKSPGIVERFLFLFKFYLFLFLVVLVITHAKQALYYQPLTQLPDFCFDLNVLTYNNSQVYY